MNGRCLLRYLWAAPVTIPAATLALLAHLTGSALMLRAGVLEASGGGLGWVLRRIYPPMSIAAITLGHVVLAQTPGDLETSRDHERVHVRQYERWGALFPALYLLAGLAALVRGAHPYHDNRFEVEARLLAPIPDQA
jgi:hypothetical protein